MERATTYPYQVITPRAVAVPAQRPSLWAGRSVAERLEWMALVVLPLSALVAAVSLLGHAVR